MAVRDLPKVETRVRFPLPAPQDILKYFQTYLDYMENKRLQSLYANPDQEMGEHIQTWEVEELKTYKEYTEQLYQNLLASELLPKDMNGFVFLSVSSNKADKERLLAELLDKDLEGKVFDKKPSIIAADFFGTQNQDTATAQTFTPGFKPDEQPKVANVNFSYLSADAYHLPLADESVTVIFDRLGVLHHAIKLNEAGKPPVDSLISLLKYWNLKLKPNGSIITDASDLPPNPEVVEPTMSKLEYYIKNFVRNYDWTDLISDLNDIGYESSFIGSGGNRLWRLQKV